MTSLREAYRWHRRERGAPRERLILYSLRLLLRDNGFVVRRIRGRTQAMTPEHIPDLMVRYRGRFVASIEVTGTELGWEQMKLKAVFVLPSKVEYGAKAGERYIYAYFNDWEFPTGEWLLWLNGRELARQADEAEARGDIWTGETCHGVIERYYMIPRKKFNGGEAGRGLISLAHYIRWLAGLVPEPDPWALANFMA